MPRIRTVKPELFRHEALFDAEIQESMPLRLAFIGLFTCCDREGRFRWRPRQLKLDIFPYDEIDMERVLDALVTRGFIVKHALENEIIGEIPSWHKHQVINNREKESNIFISDVSEHEKNNDPNKNNALEKNIDACATRESRDTEMHKRKGKRKGKGNIYREVASATSPDGVVELFEYWKTVLNHPKAVLDNKRRRLLSNALQKYELTQLKKAIDGCRASEWHMGANPDKKVYDGIDLIFRDAEHIEKFIAVTQVNSSSIQLTPIAAEY